MKILLRNRITRRRVSRWVGIAREGGDIRLSSTLVPKVCREERDIALFITLVPKVCREGGDIALFITLVPLSI